MKAVGKVAGYLLGIGASLLMFFFWLTTLSGWMGGLGTLLAFVIAPGVIIFPFVFWLAEGVFPTDYFILWGAMLGGFFIAGISSKDD